VSLTLLPGGLFSHDASEIIGDECSGAAAEAFICLNANPCDASLVTRPSVSAGADVIVLQHDSDVVRRTRAVAQA
jgi:hypothetical protein